MDDVTPEQWLPIPGFAGFYDASSLGRVRSLPRKFCRGQVLNPSVMPNGYLTVTLSVHNVQTRDYVHRFVAATFLGRCPEGMEVLHGDGNPANNAASNLRYGTHTENAQDMVRHGRSIAGTRHPFTNLTATDVATIRAARQQGVSGVALAAMYNTSKAAITRLTTGQTYKSTADVNFVVTDAMRAEWQQIIDVETQAKLEHNRAASAARWNGHVAISDAERMRRRRARLRAEREREAVSA